MLYSVRILTAARLSFWRTLDMSDLPELLYLSQWSVTGRIKILPTNALTAIQDCGPTSADSMSAVQTQTDPFQHVNVCIYRPDGKHCICFIPNAFTFMHLAGALI